MKRKSFNKKLVLSKTTVSRLSNQDKSNVYGGVNTTSPGDGATCIQSCFDACLPDPSDGCNPSRNILCIPDSRSFCTTTTC
ncbi:MAG: class I lanthipeptide [Thiohalospira sp.]